MKPPGPILTKSGDYAFRGWLLHHLVQIWDPTWFDVPFSSIVLFAVFGVAKGLDSHYETAHDAPTGDIQ